MAGMFEQPAPLRKSMRHTRRESKAGRAQLSLFLRPRPRKKVNNHSLAMRLLDTADRTTRQEEHIRKPFCPGAPSHRRQHLLSGIGRRMVGRRRKQTTKFRPSSAPGRSTPTSATSVRSRKMVRMAEGGGRGKAARDVVVDSVGEGLAVADSVAVVDPQAR